MIIKTSRNRILVATLALLASLFFTHSAMALDAVQNMENVPITTTQDLSMMDIERAIVNGGKVRGWQSRIIEPGHIEATIHVRKHMAKVDIHYTTESYSITYKDSEALKYKNGKIHRNYNKWVQNLNNDIQAKIPY